MKINCVVVTYNRLSLLKECLAALESQTYAPNQIVIIDNCSTDGTEAFLRGLPEGKYYVVRTERNLGGAGGFSLGLKTAVAAGCDFAWLMDDDTIPEPTALEELVKVASADPGVGFVCSRVDWTDGMPHVMNKAALICDKRGNPLPLQEAGQPASRCRLCSFVSVLVNADAVRKVGLPVKEFFIWCDDIEYTLRISDAGYPCYFAPQSVAVHKTASNYSPAIHEVPASLAWRFYYQARNRCYMKRRKTRNKLIFFVSVWNMYRIYKQRIRRRKDKAGQKAFLDAVRRGCKDGLTFCPEIEYLPPLNEHDCPKTALEKA